MKTLKFVKDRGQFTATLRKNVNDYFKEKGVSTKGNFKMVLKSIAMLSIYFAPFILMLTLPMSDWLIFPLSIVMGIGMAGIGMGVMHDAAHGSFSKKGSLNKLFSSTMYFIGGNTFNWKVQHNILHHTYTNIEGFDEDIEPKAALRLSKHLPLKKMHRFQHVYAFFLYFLMTISRTTNEFGQLIKYNKAGITKQLGSTPRREMIKLILTKAGYLLVIIGMPLIFSDFNWWLILIGFLIMHFTAGIFMTTVFQMAHLVEEAEQPLPDTEGLINNEWTIHELETTVNFGRKSHVFGWMIGGLNFQIEHHLFPNICHVHYKAISPIVERTAKEFGLRYNHNSTFFTAIGSHIRMLKALGKPEACLIKINNQ
jgi:linoleoyl-CoA desaturase